MARYPVSICSVPIELYRIKGICQMQMPYLSVFRRRQSFPSLAFNNKSILNKNRRYTEWIYQWSFFMSYLLNLIFNHTFNRKLTPSKVLFAGGFSQKNLQTFHRNHFLRQNQGLERCFPVLWPSFGILPELRARIFQDLKDFSRLMAKLTGYAWKLK